MITSQGHDGAYKLVYQVSGANVEKGDPVKDRDNATWTITGGRSPHSPASTGRVWVTSVGGGDREFYPGVFDLKWEKMP